MGTSIGACITALSFSDKGNRRVVRWCGVVLSDLAESRYQAGLRCESATNG